MALFTGTDQHDIEQAIAAIEKRTAGELVVGVVKRSHDYAVFRAPLTALWAISATLLLHWLWPQLSVSTLLLLQMPLAALLWPLSGRGPLLRLLVPPALQDTFVRRRAFQFFAERGIHHTRDQSGLLIMISEQEHEVVILGDKGIHDRISAQTDVAGGGWDTYVKRITQGLRQRRGCGCWRWRERRRGHEQAKEALLGVLTDLGDILAADFPPRAKGDNPNELPNAVVKG